MNDFTKEELIELIDSFDWIEGETSWEWKHELRHKIQSMIDNYCEHDCKATIWQCQVTACSKCGYPSTLITRKNDNQ